MIYFDNAATTAMSEAALDALMEVSRNQYGNPSSVYGFGRKSKDLLEQSRKIIAGCIGAEPEEIFFTSCGTESDNWVISQIGSVWNSAITTAIEHHAILYPAEEKAAEGYNIRLLTVDENCMVSEDALQNALTGAPELVSVMLQNNEVGAIQDIKRLAKIVHERNEKSLFHTDAVQAIGHIPVNVKDLGIDMLSASAHKFNGPKGIGFLYIRKGCNLKAFILGGGQEKKMRSGTENVASIYSMAKALEDNVNNMGTVHEHVYKLEKYFIALLKREGIQFRINGNSDNRATGILNIAFENLDGEGLLNMLDMHDICISIGSACNSKSQDRSHVLQAMGLSESSIDSSVRISIGRFNTEKDVETLVKWIRKYRDITILADS